MDEIIMPRKDVKYFYERAVYKDEIRSLYNRVKLKGFSGMENIVREMKKWIGHIPKHRKLYDVNVTDLFMEDVDGYYYNFSIKELSKMRKRGLSDDTIYTLFVTAIDRGFIKKVNILQSMNGMSKRYKEKDRFIGNTSLSFTYPTEKELKIHSTSKKMSKLESFIYKAPNRHTKRAFYQTKEWKLTRRKIFRTYGYSCMKCKDECPTTIYHIDHIKPISNYWHLRLDINNLQVLCESCNIEKSNKNCNDYRPKTILRKRRDGDYANINRKKTNNR